MSNLPTQIEPPGVAFSQTIPRGTVAVKVSNTSPYDLNISGYGTPEDDWIPGGTEWMLYANVYDSGALEMTLVNNRNVSPPNAGVVLLVAYYSQATLPTGTWPISIPFGLVNATVAVSQFITNTGFPPAEVFIFAEPNGDTSAQGTVNFNNSGQASLGDSLYNGSLLITGIPSGGGTDQISYTNKFIDMFNHDGSGLEFTTGHQIANGAGGGNVELFQWMQGSLKIVNIYLNNFACGGSSFSMIFPTSYTGRALVITDHLGNSAYWPGFQVYNGGTLITAINTLTSLSSTGGGVTSTSTLYGMMYSSVLGPFDRIAWVAPNPNASSGNIMIIGE